MIKNGRYSKWDTQSQKSINFVLFTREPGGGQVLIAPDFRSVKTKFKKIKQQQKPSTLAPFLSWTPPLFRSRSHYSTDTKGHADTLQMPLKSDTAFA